MVALIGEPALGFKRGLAAVSRGGDRLAVAMVHDVAGREHALDGGSRAIVGDDVAVFVEL